MKSHTREAKTKYGKEEMTLKNSMNTTAKQNGVGVRYYEFYFIAANLGIRPVSELLNIKRRDENQRQI